MLTDDPDEQIRLLMDQARSTAVDCRGLDLRPEFDQPIDVGCDLLGRGVHGGGANDHTELVRLDLGQNLPQTDPLRFRQPTGNALAIGIGNQNQVTPGQRGNTGQTSPFGPHRVLGHLDQDLVTFLE